MSRHQYPEVSAPSSNHAYNPYHQSDNRKHHTSSEERMVGFQEFVDRYES
jgi:hypothetical protein